MNYRLQPDMIGQRVDSRSLAQSHIRRALSQNSDFRQNLNQSTQPVDFWYVLLVYLSERVPIGTNQGEWVTLVDEEINGYRSSASGGLVDYALKASDVKPLTGHEVLEQHIRKLPITFGKYAYIVLDDVLKLFNPTQETQELPMEEKRNKTEEHSSIEPGMIVYLRSGSPALTIELITGAGEVQVVWYDDHEFRRATFEPAMLTTQKVD